MTLLTGPKPKLADFWVSHLYRAFANEPGKPDGLIAEEVENLGAVLGEEGYPQEYPKKRTILKYKARFKQLPELTQAQYRELRWPDAVDDGLMPWQAARAIFELLDWVGEHSLSLPPISLAKEFWRVSEVLPQAPIGQRIRLAVTIASHQEADQPLPQIYKDVLAGESSATLEQLPMKVAVGGVTSSWAVQFVLDKEKKQALYVSGKPDQPFKPSVSTGPAPGPVDRPLG